MSLDLKFAQRACHSNQRAARYARWVGVSIIVAGLSGCAVGPNYHRPAAPSVSAYAAPAVQKGAIQSGAADQTVVMGARIKGQWWQAFHSHTLDQLIATSLARNPSLVAAQNTLLAARDQTRALEGGFLPSLSGSFQAARERQGGLSNTTNALGASGQSGGAAPFELLNASVSVSYAPDIFGLLRREVESQRAVAQQQRFALEASYLSLTANIVTAAVSDASLRAQIKATQRILASQTHDLRILRRQLALGGISEANVLTQEALRAQTAATVPPLEKQLAQIRNQLAAYEGVFPTQFHDPNLDLTALHLPHHLPLSLPSKLVDQRPDIREAAALVHQESAAVGVATADMLPQITLSASVGHDALSAATLFTPQTLIWNLVSGVTQPLFEGGNLLFKRRAAIATLRASAADYQNTVVLAFQNVSDSLAALHYDAQALAADRSAENAAQRSLKVTREQFKLGAVSFTTVLTAEQTYDKTVITMIQATAQRYADTAALFQSLGGGWWHRQDVTPTVRKCCGVFP